eukprot:7161638-Prymnesium_polylepis.1
MAIARSQVARNRLAIRPTGRLKATRHGAEWPALTTPGRPTRQLAPHLIHFGFECCYGVLQRA